jgi:NADPH:quinone reductase-like Zn-dependent oxidoreductase
VTTLTEPFSGPIIAAGGFDGASAEAIVASGDATSSRSAVISPGGGSAVLPQAQSAAHAACPRRFLGPNRKALLRLPDLRSRADGLNRAFHSFTHPDQEVHMSRTIKFAQAGGPEVLEFVDTEVRAPGPNEVRIDVKAIGINRAESMWRLNDYIEPVKFPAGLGYEAAGIVNAVGSDVTGIAVGDEVNLIPSFSMNDYGTYGEVIIAPDYAVVKHPKSLSYAEAASVWMMFVTAYGALIEDAKVGKGDFVIIPAASSSVGLAAIQIVNYAGATSIALTRTSAKRAQLLEAGATHVIATEDTDVVKEVARITDGKGARVAFDPVGGPALSKLLAALSFNGTVYLYGLLSSEVTALPVLDMIAKVTSVKAHNIWMTSGDATRRKAAVEYVLKGLESGALKPIIDRQFRFDEMVDVHRYLEKNGQFGKIVVTL